MYECSFSLQQHFNAFLILIQKHKMPCAFLKTLNLFMIAQSVVTDLFSLQFPIAIG